MRVTCVVGARPNFVKAAALVRAFGARNVRPRLVHTGQHYDRRLSALLFEELQLPEPDASLGVGSGTHAVQTARILEAFDRELDAHPADCVVVMGDVNSTLACALVAVKRGIPVAHVEAGLRSADRGMPEEINRILTDQIAEYLFTTEAAASENLLREGIPEARVHFVGNVMIDTLLHSRARAAERNIVRDLGYSPGAYAVCTVHRPSNLDEPEWAENTARAVETLATRLPVIFPAHPRTRAKLAAHGLLERLERAVQVVEPLGYLDFLRLMEQARVVFTDSGGIQEETTALGVPCLTFRTTTERPVTVTHGTNRIVGVDPARTAAAMDAVLAGGRPASALPELWDGRAAERVVDRLLQRPSRPAPPDTRARGADLEEVRPA